MMIFEALNSFKLENMGCAYDDRQFLFNQVRKQQRSLKTRGPAHTGTFSEAAASTDFHSQMFEGSPPMRDSVYSVFLFTRSLHPLFKPTNYQKWKLPLNNGKSLVCPR